MSEIKPAVRLSEWKFSCQIAYGEKMSCKHKKGRVWVRAPNNSGCERMHEVTSIRHALATFCLHEQPFGFTRDDVTLLRLLRCTDKGWMAVKEIGSIIDRIESLLPPENNHGRSPDRTQNIAQHAR